MKVAYLIGSLNRGGAETLLLDIFRNSEKASYEMMLIHRKGGMYEREFEQKSSHCYKISPRRCHLFSYLRQLRTKLVKEKATIVHAFYPLDAVYAKLATIGKKIPIVLTFHGYLGGEARGVSRLYYHILIRIVDKICFVSGEQMKRYEQRYGAIVRKKGIGLYNGLNFDKFEVVNEGVKKTFEQERDKNDLTNERGIRLCMVGNFNSVRSQIVVCKVLLKLKEKIEFYFVGGRYKGEEHYYDECVAYCKEHGMENVHFLGTRNDVPALLKTMDGFVYSSRNDTFGIAVIEAIASGLPVVVNDHPVMQEVCGETNEGIRYFKTDDADDAAARIEDMITNIEQSKEQAKENATKVRAKYSIESHINNVYQIYSTL